MIHRTIWPIALVVASACSLETRPALTRERIAELWQEPVDLEDRNLLYGRGPRELVPDERGTYTLIEAEDDGFSAGYEVRDAEGRIWDVKLGLEAQPEVVVSRLLWAIGYYQPVVYYVPRWTLTDKGRSVRQGEARFRLEAEEDVSDWSWTDNPFIGTLPFEGLFVFMVMVNNWDLKTSQNGIFQQSSARDGPRRVYVVKDLGASLGKTSWILPGSRNNLEDFEMEPFIKSVGANRVTFHYKGAWVAPHLAANVTPAGVRWISDLLARLTLQQWKDAFRAGGYAQADADRYIKRLQGKIAEGQNIR